MEVGERPMQRSIRSGTTMIARVDLRFSPHCEERQEGIQYVLEYAVLGCTEAVVLPPDSGDWREANPANRR